MLISPENHGKSWQNTTGTQTPLENHRSHRRHGGRDEGEVGKLDRTATTAGEPASISATAMSYQAYSAESSMQLQIATKDGDTVTIHIARSYQEQSTALQHAYGDGIYAASEFSRSTSAQLEFTVEGNLSEDEEKSIHHLLKKLNGVVNQFENGDSDQALEHAAKIKLDDSALASFSLELSSHQESQAMEMVDVRSATPPKTTPAADSIPQQLAALLSFAEQQTPMQNPLASLRTLFDSLKQFSSRESDSKIN